LPALSYDNAHRLPRVGGRVKEKVEGTKRQAASVRGRVTGAWESKDIYDALHWKAGSERCFWHSAWIQLVSKLHKVQGVL
jgi:hypothetical protein